MLVQVENMVSFNLRSRVVIGSNAKRFLHGPAAVVAPNGDWLVVYQDAIDDPSHDGFIHQMRSQDQGKTWLDDGAVYDERNKGVGCANPTFGLTANGHMVLVIQRRAVCEKEGHPTELLNSTYCVSSDNGRSYEHRGFVDPLRPRGHWGSPSHILLRDGVLHMVAEGADGIVLYTSEDNALSWHRRSMIFEPSDFNEHPYYSSIIFRPDSTLLCQCHLLNSMKNYHRISEDSGYTWSDLKPANIHLRHPVLTYVGDIMVAVGRLMPQWRTGFYLSDDDGENWKGPFDLAPNLPHGGGGYTAVIPLKDQVFIVFSSFLPLPGSVACGPMGSAGEPNAIQGVMLKDICVEGT
jgi:hypothetical protein